MDNLIVLTRPALVCGFQLAGVEAYAAADARAAQDLIDQWIKSDKKGLLAIDNSLLSQMDPAFLRRIDKAENFSYISIPSGKQVTSEESIKFRIAEMMRQAIGFHITFKGEGEVKP
jgi:vacuolar-type H+-ATPase subunit F/Vma7